MASLHSPGGHNKPLTRLFQNKDQIDNPCVISGGRLKCESVRLAGELKRGSTTMENAVVTRKKEAGAPPGGIPVPGERRRPSAKPRRKLSGRACEELGRFA
jgi:hypothetical protein